MKRAPRLWDMKTIDKADADADADENVDNVDNDAEDEKSATIVGYENN